jgi:hypothetical protein
MLLASRIAWRNDPDPLSVVFVTVKTKGALGLFVADGWYAASASGPLVFCVRDVRINRVGLSEVAKIDARKTEPIDINARVSAMRRAKACGEVFFFIGVWGDVQGLRGSRV